MKTSPYFRQLHNTKWRRTTVADHWNTLIKEFKKF